MEKLLELLNEYDPYIASDGEHKDNLWYLVYKGGSAIFPKNIGENVIISKSYGFIKRLDENDKIDCDKCDVINDIYNDELPRKYKRYDAILMGLAIQDEPISFLISILK